MPRARVDTWAALRGLFVVLVIGIAVLVGGSWGYVDPEIGRPTAWTQTVLPLLALMALPFVMFAAAIKLCALRVLPLLIVTDGGRGSVAMRTSLLGRRAVLRRTGPGVLRVVLREHFLPHRTLRGTLREVPHLELTFEAGDGRPPRVSLQNHRVDYDWEAWLERELEKVGVPAEVETVRTDR